MSNTKEKRVNYIVLYEGDSVLMHGFDAIKDGETFYVYITPIEPGVFITKEDPQKKSSDQPRIVLVMTRDRVIESRDLILFLKFHKLFDKEFDHYDWPIREFYYSASYHSAFGYHF